MTVVLRWEKGHWCDIQWFNAGHQQLWFSRIPSGGIWVSTRKPEEQG